jgi:putative ABC transport system permease protein
MKQNFLLAFRNLKNRKLRSWLTIIGVIIGVATIVSLITLGQGMENAIEDIFMKLGVSNIRVVPAGLNGPPTASMGLSVSDAEYIDSIIGIEYVDQALFNYANVEYSGETQFIQTLAFDTTIGTKGLGDLDLDAVEGRLFEQDETGTVIIGWKVAKNLFDKTIRARNSIKIEGVKFRVIGIFENTGTDVDNQIMMPLETARELFDKPDIVNAIVAKIEDGMDMEAMAEKIEAKLARKRDKDDFEVFTPQQLMEEIQGMLASVSLVLIAISIVSLVVGGIGIMNSLFTSVLERTREIGVMKAIGATNFTILSLFIMEAGLVGAVGGFIGATIGTIMAFLIGFGATAAGFPLLIIKFNIALFLQGIFLAIIVGIIAGVIPAIRASRLKPVDALRYE